MCMLGTQVLTNDFKKTYDLMTKPKTNYDIRWNAFGIFYNHQSALLSSTPYSPRSDRTTFRVYQAFYFGSCKRQKVSSKILKCLCTQTRKKQRKRITN